MNLLSGLCRGITFIASIVITTLCVKNRIDENGFVIGCMIVGVCANIGWHQNNRQV